MSSDYIQDEKEWVKNLKQGEQEAFNQLFYAYERKLYRFSYKLVHSREDAEGIVQEVFLRVWDKRASLNEDLSFNAYLFKIAKNLIYNRTSRKITEHAYQEYAHYFSPQMRHLTEEAVFFSDLNSINARFMEQLPVKRKQIFLLSRTEGLNNKEIAKQLNISVSTVENQINKTLKSLRDYLCQYDINLPLLIIFYFFS